MASLILYGFVALIAIAVLYGLAILLLPAGEQMAPPAPDVKPWSLTDEPLNAQDVIDVRLPVALRGYRFAETDRLLDRLTEELRQRDEEIARLRGDGAASTPVESTSAGLGTSADALSAPSYDPSAVREY